MKKSFITELDLEKIIDDVDKDIYSKEELKEMIKLLITKFKEAEEIAINNKIKFDMVYGIINHIKKY